MKRFACLWLALTITGCSTMQSYHADQIGPHLPIAEGDEIVLYPKDPGAESKPLTVTSIDADAISGRPAGQAGAIVTYHWSAIARIEQQRFDSGKTSGLVILAAVLLYVADSLGDGFENISDIFDTEE